MKFALNLWTVPLLVIYQWIKPSQLVTCKPSLKEHSSLILVLKGVIWCKLKSTSAKARAILKIFWVNQVALKLGVYLEFDTFWQPPNLHVTAYIPLADERQFTWLSNISVFLEHYILSDGIGVHFYSSSILVLYAIWLSSILHEHWQFGKHVTLSYMLLANKRCYFLV